MADCLPETRYVKIRSGGNGDNVSKCHYSVPIRPNPGLRDKGRDGARPYVIQNDWQWQGGALHPPTVRVNESIQVESEHVSATRSG